MRRLEPLRTRVGTGGAKGLGGADGAGDAGTFLRPVRGERANVLGPRVVRAGHELRLSASLVWRRQRLAPRALPIPPRLRCAAASAAASRAFLRPHLVP